MPLPKKLALLLGPIVILFLILILLISLNKRDPVDKPLLPTTREGKEESIELKEKAKATRNFAKVRNYNTEICFLVDMSLLSGHNRFFVYDMAKDSILTSSRVAHGRCNQNWLEGRKYGNAIGCGCTSIGRYKIGQPYVGKFGRAYKLYGLDISNSNAFARFIVLHSYHAMPDSETEEEICQSDGCPMVSKQFLEELRPIIDGSTRPILLWIYQ